MDYENISLREFFRVSQSGDVSTVGGDAGWEKIVARNAKENGSHGLVNYKQTLKQINLLRADYLLVKASLTKLNFMVDSDAINFLRVKGFAINIGNASAYQQSLLVANRVSENLVSKIQSREKELERLATKKGEPATFQGILASLSIALGFNVPEEVKLAWFNEAKKTIKRKEEGKRRRNG